MVVSLKRIQQTRKMTMTTMTTKSITSISIKLTSAKWMHLQERMNHCNVDDAKAEAIKMVNAHGKQQALQHTLSLLDTAVDDIIEHCDHDDDCTFDHELDAAFALLTHDIIAASPDPADNDHQAKLMEMTGMSDEHMSQLLSLAVMIEDEGDADFTDAALTSQAILLIKAYGKEAALHDVVHALVCELAVMTGSCPMSSTHRWQNDAAWFASLALTIMEVPEITVEEVPERGCGRADDIIHVMDSGASTALNQWCKIGGVLEGQEGRQVFQGPLVPGPWFWINPMTTAMSSKPGMGTMADIARAKAAGKYHTVSIGGAVLINGTLYKISFANSWNHDLKLVEVK